MTDLVIAKRIVMMGASDLEVSARRTIAAGRWTGGHPGWCCAAPGSQLVLIQRDGRGLFLPVMDQGARFARNVGVDPS